MQPILMIVLATATGVPLGLWLRRDLATLGYRKEDEQALPDPGRRSWVVWGSAVTLGSLAASVALGQNPQAYLPLIPLAIAGPWLAAVDFDVLRIPNGPLAFAAVATLLSIVGLAGAGGEWRTLVVPIATAAATGGVFAAVHFATRGGIGFGDVKLAAVVGLAVGSLGFRAMWIGLLAGSVVGILWARSSRRVGPIPYGPWLLCGALLSALASSILGR